MASDLSQTAAPGVAVEQALKKLQEMEPTGYSGVERTDVDVGITRDAVLRWVRADEEDEPLYSLADIRTALLAGAAGGERPCTCNPDDNPPTPCAKKYALTDCRAADLSGMPTIWAVIRDGCVVATHDAPGTLDGIDAVPYSPSRALATQCEHEFHHFGDQPGRRCAKCNQPESAAPPATVAAQGEVTDAEIYQVAVRENILMRTTEREAVTFGRAILSLAASHQGTDGGAK